MVTEPLGCSVCGAKSPPMMTTCVAFAVCQLRTTGAPAAAEFGGFAVNDRIWTVPTMTVTLPWICPAPFVAVAARMPDVPVEIRHECQNWGVMATRMLSVDALTLHRRQEIRLALLLLHASHIRG